MPTVLVTARSFSSGSIDVEDRLRAAGWTVIRGDAGHRLADIGDALSVCDAWIAGTGPVGAAQVDAAPSLRIVSRYGVGTEAVDLSATEARGIIVTNTPGANSDAVADHAVGLMLAALRSTTAGDRAVRHRDWSARRGRELGALTVGIVGFGRIGRGVRRRLSGFACPVLVSDPWIAEAEVADAGARMVALPELIRRSDVVTLHAPGGQLLVSTNWIDECPDDQVIVNTARPDLVDEVAVVSALHAGRLGAFAADTVSGDVRGESSALLADDLADRVTVTPHAGSLTTQAIDRMGTMAVDAVLALDRGDALEHVVTS